MEVLIGKESKKYVLWYALYSSPFPTQLIIYRLWASKSFSKCARWKKKPKTPSWGLAGAKDFAPTLASIPGLSFYCRYFNLAMGEALYNQEKETVSFILYFLFVYMVNFR